ncbi:MAG: polysaccharide biosynthesis/export family protein [Candidatus Omnitrophota bacterium]
MPGDKHTIFLRYPLFILIFCSIFCAIVFGGSFAADDLNSKYGLRNKYYEQGKSYFNKGLYEQAVAQFELALEQDSGYDLAKRYIEFAKYKMGQRSDIAQEVRQGPGGHSPQQISELIPPPEEGPGENTPSAIIYKIDKEDILDIAVWGHKDLEKQVIVRPDGKISFPFIGDVQAAGSTIPELEKRITDGLKEYVKGKLKSSGFIVNQESGEYLINNGDVLDISVWKIADLSKEVIVRPDGMISYPLVGDLKATGHTLVELDQKLTEALASFVKDPQVAVMIKSFGRKEEFADDEEFMDENPQVSVILREFGEKKVIVLGEVLKPGVYPFTNQIRLMEAIGLAGDFSKYAVKNNVFVIRGDIHKNPEVFTSNVVQLFKYSDFSQNLEIKSQDIVYVPRTLVGNISDFLEFINPTIDAFYKGQVAADIGSE